MATFAVFFLVLVLLVILALSGAALVSAGVGEMQTRFPKKPMIFLGVLILLAALGVLLFALYALAEVLMVAL